MMLAVLWLLAGCVVAWVFNRVAYRERELDETADAQMWARTIADYTKRVQR
jgi:hypothetical protein